VSKSHSQPPNHQPGKMAGAEPSPTGASAGEAIRAEKEITDMDSVASALAADLDQLRSELDDAKDRALRSAAELENYRKRANRQIEEERRYANVELIRELLPIWDNMGRVVEAAGQSDKIDALLEGFQMVRQQLESVFERYNCFKIDALHQPFDPHLHEAISQMPSADHPAGTVLHVTQAGFRVEDRVVRPSQVVVSAGPEERSPPEEVAGEAGSNRQE
jgi:molecular chaperone GrpE